MVIQQWWLKSVSSSVRIAQATVGLVCKGSGTLPYKMSAISFLLAGVRWSLAASPTATAHTLQETDWLTWRGNWNCTDKKKDRQRTQMFSFFIVVNSHINRYYSTLSISLARHQNVHPQEKTRQMQRETSSLLPSMHAPEELGLGRHLAAFLLTFRNSHDGGFTFPVTLWVNTSVLCFTVKTWEVFGWEKNTLYTYWKGKKCE